MPRNTLFITADQWRGDCLGCLGHLVRTPHLDALAAAGTLFLRHYANAAPCGPSRASIHTGAYMAQHGVRNNSAPLSGTLTNWALEARAAGLDPVLFGYTDTVLAETAPRTDVLPGLRPVVELGKDIRAPTAWAQWLGEKGYPLPAAHGDLYLATGPAIGSEPRPLAVPAKLHDTRFVVDQVIEYIAGRDTWCVHLSLLRPHPPWLAPAPYNSLYPASELPQPRYTLTAQEERHPYVRHVLGHALARVPSMDRLQRWQAGYYGLMTEVDHNLGRLFAAVKEAGQWHDTLVVFTSDHGEQMGDQGLVGKLGYFEESFHVPLILFNPAAPEAHRGRRIDAFTESVDLMPTLLDWFGVAPPAQCEGASLLPATAVANGTSKRDAAHWDYDFGTPEAQAALALEPEQCRMHVTRGPDFMDVAFPTLPPLRIAVAA